MKIFDCPVCGGDLFFDNLACSCGAPVAFAPQAQVFVADGRNCANRDVIECNWLAEEGAALCESCAMTTVHPDLRVPDNTLRWAQAERAKRRVLVGLNRWRWFREGDRGPRPEFHMLSEVTSAGAASVTMGHASGCVTINLAESDAAERVRRREELGEPYRTMVGHFRHEIAHFLFERLSASATFVDAFRDMFGDETADYGAALARHYANGPAHGWEDTFVTSYASAHPHEDWAESAAHAMHLTEIVDSFLSAGLSCAQAPAVGYDAYAERDTTRLMDAAIAIGVAINHVNRAVGQPDLYPFVNTPRIRGKLGFALTWLARGAGG